MGLRSEGRMSPIFELGWRTHGRGHELGQEPRRSSEDNVPRRLQPRRYQIGNRGDEKRGRSQSIHRV